MIKKLPIYLAFSFLILTFVLIGGWYLFSWSLVVIIPIAISTTILFFQILTLIKINIPFIRKINQLFLILQAAMLLLFLLNWVDISWIWKWNMLLFLLSTQLYLFDLIRKYHVRKFAQVLVVVSGTLSVISFILLPYWEIFLPIGLAITVFNFALVLGHLFGKRSLPLNQL